MTYGVLFIVVVMALGLIGMALILVGDGSDPRDWLGEDDAATSPDAMPPAPPALRPITSDRSYYLDHVSELPLVRADESRRAFTERLDASTSVRGSARLSHGAADATSEGVRR